MASQGTSTERKESPNQRPVLRMEILEHLMQEEKTVDRDVIKGFQREVCDRKELTTNDGSNMAKP
ncbi:hypothetical protein H5410_016710 [Solanum commersonii]|uniref:Uncharacterized protein n=1 Tax=Solanum commersonii TaxID=4109 RepID=A0A9J5ZX39_SOLCO|nr:hypothetical protein H5410_016710 [Solanum commersonii]